MSLFFNGVYMSSFHTELKILTNFNAWNKLPSGADKKEGAPSKGEAIHRIASSFLNIEADTTPTFQEFAAKVVEWIGNHADTITKEDADSLDKLRVIFSSRLPQNDKNITALKELSIASQTATDHAANIHHTFDSVTRYLPNREQLLTAAAGRVKEGEALCKTLKKSDWATIIKEYKQSPDNLATDGLKAFHDGKITMEQFSTLIFCWSLMKQFPDVEIHVQPIFDSNGEVNRAAERFLRQTFESCCLTKGQASFLDEKKFNTFLRNMKLQPDSENSFFFIKTNKFEENLDNETRKTKTLDGTFTVTEEIYQAGVNVFGQFENEGTTHRMIPSLSMMQQFLAAYAGDTNAVKIIPVIGVSKLKDIVNNTKTDTRDIGLPFPGVELPKQADKLAAPYDIDFIRHDFYHSILASDVTPEHRRAFIAYANAILESKKQAKDPFALRFLGQLNARIVDMEHPIFRQNMPNTAELPNPTEAQKFLLALSQQQMNALNRLLVGPVRELKKEDAAKDEDPFKYLFQFGANLRKQQIIEKLADVLHQQNFCLHHGITRKDLEGIAEMVKSAKEMMQDQLRQFDVWIPQDLRREFEIDGGEKITKLEAYKRAWQEPEKTDISTQLLIRMDRDAPEQKDKEAPTAEAGIVHRRAVIFEKIAELANKMRTGG